MPAAGTSPSEKPVPQTPDFVHMCSMCLPFLLYFIAPVRSSPRMCKPQHLGYVTHDLFINSCSTANTALSSWPFVLSRIFSSLHQQQGISFWKMMSKLTAITLFCFFYSLFLLSVKNKNIQVLRFCFFLTDFCCALHFSLHFIT